MKVTLEDGNVIEVGLDSVVMTDEEIKSLANVNEEDIFDTKELADQLKTVKEKMQEIETNLTSSQQTIDTMKKEFSKMYLDGGQKKDDEDDEDDELQTTEEIIDELKGEF